MKMSSQSSGESATPTRKYDREKAAAIWSAAYYISHLDALLDTYRNNWIAPTHMVSVEDSSLRGGGHVLKQKIWTTVQDTIQEWTGEELTQCSLYGIRVYHEGAVLGTHVDRLPLVSSAIINVAQDVDEPWPLEVIGHDGKAVNVTMEPGDMVLYESHSVLHGRPFPLKGRFMANIFIHFEPTGHSLRHNAEQGGMKNVHKEYKESLARGHGGHENQNNGIPPYVIAGTPEEANWRRNHPSGYVAKESSFTTGSTIAHIAAQHGQLDTLKSELEKQKSLVDALDENGWTALHEGARGGHLEVVKYLIESGANVNATTGDTGGTVLWWAKQVLDEDHPVIQLLQTMNAADAGPEL
jgi:prolyl 4-hydroxylase